MLAVRTKTQSFDIACDRVAQYPGSLFHGLLSSVDASAGPGQDVTGDLSSPSLGGDLWDTCTEAVDASAAPGQDVTLDLTSPKFDGIPLNTWTEAAGITADIYRQGFISVDRVVSLVDSCTLNDLVQRLQQLIDYLALPGPLNKWLPPTDKVPLRHLGVVRLKHHGLAVDAVERMLNFMPFTKELAASTDKHQAVFFSMVQPDCDLTERLTVYAVAAPTQFNSAEWRSSFKQLQQPVADSTLCMFTRVGPKAYQLPPINSSAGASIAVQDLVCGAQLKIGLVPCNSGLGMTVTAVLEQATRSIAAGTGVQAKCAHTVMNVVGDRCWSVPVWVVYW